MDKGANARTDAIIGNGVVMAFWHGYFGIENINLNTAQKSDLVDALKEPGNNTAPQPCYRNHRRFRLDGDAAIFEARWNKDNIVADKFKQYLGNIFGIDPATIDHVITTPGSNIVAVFSRGGTDYLRIAFFGGLSCTWEESRQAVLTYLRINRELWDG